MIMHGKRLFVTAFVLLSGLASGLWAAETRVVTILGSSDGHGYFVPWDYATDTAFPAGGLSKIATVANRLRAENPDLILVDAGDLIQGNFTETFKAEKTNPMMLGLNAARYDIFVPGNHEFNFGMGALNTALSTFKGKALAGNIYKTKDASRFLPATAIIERNGIRIGFIGMTTPMTTQFEAGTDHLDGIEIRKPVVDTRAAVLELKGKVDAIVGVMHMGEANENANAETGVAEIIAAVPGMDVVFAGHMHLRVPGKEIGGTLLVEPYMFAQNLSRVDLSFEKTDSGWALKGKKPELLALAVEKSDPEVEKVYAPFHDILRTQANSVIGKVVGGNMVDPDAIKGIPTVQVADTPLVSLFHDACLYYSKADVVSLQIDNNAAKLDAGEIKRKDIAFNYQYALGEITNYRMSGAELKTYMEWSADYFNTLKAGDVTYSFNPVRRASKYSTNDFFGGISYTINLTKNAGERVENLRFSDGREVGPNSSVVVGMNSYRLAQLMGKGGIFEGKTFAPLTDTKTVFGEDDGIIRALIVRYVKKVKNGKVEANADNSWRLTGLDPALDRERLVVTDLLNRGVIQIPSSGTFTNVASINVKGKATSTPAEQAEMLAGLDARLAAAVKDEEKVALRVDIELVKALKRF